MILKPRNYLAAKGQAMHSEAPLFVKGDLVSLYRRDGELTVVGYNTHYCPDVGYVNVYLLAGDGPEELYAWETDLTLWERDGDPHELPGVTGVSL